MALRPLGAHLASHKGPSRSIALRTGAATTALQHSISLTFSKSDSAGNYSRTVLENLSLHLRNSLAILR